MRRTPEQIRTMGLAVLRRELGAAGMVRFLQQFDGGSGDWANERDAWAKRTTLEDIRKAAQRPRRRRAKTT